MDNEDYQSTYHTPATYVTYINLESGCGWVISYHTLSLWKLAKLFLLVKNTYNYYVHRLYMCLSEKLDTGSADIV